MCVGMCVILGSPLAARERKLIYALGRRRMLLNSGDNFVVTFSQLVRLSVEVRGLCLCSVQDMLHMLGTEYADIEFNSWRVNSEISNKFSVLSLKFDYIRLFI